VEYDEDDESASPPPIPMQILVEAEDNTEKADSVEEQPSGNSDEMYLKIKEAGITQQQFRALAQAGLTIAEG